MNSRYPNSSQLKGKNRYIRWDNDLLVAINAHWNYAIAIRPKSAGTVFGVFQKRNKYIVNPDKIVHKSGGMN